MPVILTKRGNLASMPMLQYGELAYAQDKRRLFCGATGGGENVNLTPIQYTPLSTEANPPGGLIPRYTLNGNDSTVENYSSIDFRFFVSGGALANRIPAYTFLTGYKTEITSGKYSTIFGGNNIISGDNSFCCGANNTTASQNSLVGGYLNSTVAEGCIVAGSNNTVQGVNIACFGRANTAGSSGRGNLIGGESNSVNSQYSLCAGASNTLNSFGGAVLGVFNKEPTGWSQGTVQPTNNMLMVGNGLSASQRSNCFRVRADGNIFGLAAFNSTGADYAEYFEWEDGNKSREDRVGRFVEFSNADKIAIAKEGATPLGIVSGKPSVVGNSHSDVWRNMYMLDDFGRTLYEEVDGVKTPILNPDYNPEEEYLSREQRPEWDPIGLLGRMRVFDDGSCQVGGHCTCGNNGVAISSNEGYRVLARISTNVIEIFFK